MPGRNDLGRRTSVENAGPAFSQTEFNLFGYNDRSELTSSNRYAGTYTPTPDPQTEITAEQRLFNYDPIGNRTDATAGTGSATYYCANSVNQYTATSAASDCPTPSTPIDSFTYDEDGNLRLDDQYEYVWDAENRLIEITTRIDLGGYFGGYDEGDQRLRFGYDYMGRRSEKTHEVHTSGNWVMQSAYPKWFIYDGWNVQLVLRPGSAYDPVTNPTDIVTERKYTWGLDLSGSFHAAGGIGGLLAAVETQGTSQTGDDVSYWYVYDANGNVGQLINGTTPSTPVLAAHYEYDPFGNLLAAVDVDSSSYVNINPFRFSTKWLDYEIGGTTLGTTITGAVGSDGLYYYGYRYYSPRLGRWIKRDPIGEQGGIGLYLFASNLPTYGVDALGLWDVERAGGATALAVAQTGDTIARLAAEIGLEPHEYLLWLAPAPPPGPTPKRTTQPATQPSTQPATQPVLPTSEYQVLNGCERYMIPNTVLAYWGGELGGFGKWWVYWDEDIATLRKRGFNVEEHEQWKAKELEDYIVKQTTAKELQGIFFWGHGLSYDAPDPTSWWRRIDLGYHGVLTDSGQSGAPKTHFRRIQHPGGPYQARLSDYESWYEDWHPTYRLGVGLLFACGTNAALNHPIFSTSKERVFSGKPGVLWPHGLHLFADEMDQLIPPGKQRTKT